jgi:hypothetical protein
MNITALAIALEDSEKDKWFDASDLCEQLGVNSWDVDQCVLEDDGRITKHWHQKWLCTDTIVGDAIYYFDRKPLAYSYQPARKSDEIFHFFSKEIALAAQTYLMSLIKIEKTIAIAELTMEVKDYSDEVASSRYRW